jgi:hypothetical protein
MKSKKGVELTVNTMIVLLLAIIVLVVLVFMFTGIIKPAGPVLAGCQQKYGASVAKCMDDTECESSGGRKDWTAKCPENGPQTCCLFSEQT